MNIFSNFLYIYVKGGDKMGRKLFNKLGRIDISADVISAIASQAAAECSGLVAVSGKGFGDGLAQLFGKSRNYRSAEIFSLEDGKVSISLNIILKYGVKAAEASKTVMNRVKEVVEGTTGLVVEKVDVIIHGVHSNDSKLG